MKRFVKVALLLAAMALAVTGVAFAVPFAPGDLVDDVNHYDIRLLASGDQTQVHKTIVAPVSGDEVNADNEVVVDGSEFANFFVTSEDPTTLAIAAGDDPLWPWQGTSFDFYLVRSTFSSKVPMTVAVSSDYADYYFGLVGGNEIGTPVRDAAHLAGDCTLECDNFYFTLQDGQVGAAGREFALDLRWTDSDVYDVECCDHLAFGVASTDAPTELEASTDRLGVVVAHLNEENPFVRVRVSQQQQNEVSGDVFGPLNGAPQGALVDGLVLRELSADNRVEGRTPVDDHYFDRLVDVPYNETLHMGVYYADETSCDLYCADTYCWHPELPYVSVTNFGTDALDISDLYLTRGTNDEFDVEEWLCNSWCGLCEIDDMMSGDFGSLGWNHEHLDLAIANDDPSHVLSQSALANCICKIYPAFTHTFKAAGNIGIDWVAHQVRTQSSDPWTPLVNIDGRIHVSWQKLVVDPVTPGDPICPTCPEDEQNSGFFWTPCPCLLIDYDETEPLFVNAKFVDSVDQVVALADPTAADNADADTKIHGVAFDRSDLAIAAEKNYMLVRLSWTVDADALVSAGLVGDLGDKWWRTEFWNKFDVKLNDKVLRGIMTAEELAYMAVMDGPQGVLTADDDVRVDLFVFVTDKEVANDVYYTDHAIHGPMIIAETLGGEFGDFSVKGAVVPATTPDPGDEFAINPAGPFVVEVDDVVNLDAINLPDDAVVSWDVEQASEYLSFAEVSGEPTQIDVAVNAAFEGNLYVIANAIVDDEVVASDEVEFRMEETPAPSGSGGGCSMGFAPAALLLLAPLGFLRRK